MSETSRGGRISARRSMIKNCRSTLLQMELYHSRFSEQVEAVGPDDVLDGRH